MELKLQVSLPKRMRILFVTKDYYPNISGGGEISLKLLAESLVKGGHKITVIAFDGNKKEVINNVEIIRKDLCNKKFQHPPAVFME